MNVSWPPPAVLAEGHDAEPPDPLGAPAATPVGPWTRATVCAACALSALGAALLLGTHAAWPALRTPARRLLAGLAAADLVSALAYLYGVVRDFHADSWGCAAQGAVSSMANAASFFLNVAVALHLYVAIVRGEPRMAERMHVCLHLVSWLVPALCSSLAFALGHLGYDGSAVSVGWCWVRLHAPGALPWALLTGKLWELLAYGLLPALYLLTVHHIRRVRKELSEYRPLLRARGAGGCSPFPVKLLLIPALFIGLRVWSSVRFFLALSDSPALHHPALVLLHGVGNSLHGAANCALFVFGTRPVRERLLHSLCCRPAPSPRIRCHVEENGA